MKKYIFLTNAISSIGGGQLYVSRKLEYLKKNKWEVEVYYTDYGDIMIDNLKPFVENQLQVLCVPLDYVSKEEREKVLKHFSLSDNTIIETHLIHLSVWGEYIAKHIGAKHIAYFLCEQFPPLSHEVADFLKFKLKQSTLYGITPKSIPALFRENIDGTSYGLMAVGSYANVGGIDSRIELLPNADYTILSLGRTDKPYISNMVLSIKDFAELNKNSKINLVIVGNSQSCEKVFEPLALVSNVNVLMLGKISPIPCNVFTVSDVAIATAGCVKITSGNDVPTIVADGNDYEAIGVYGYTTFNGLFRNPDEPLLKISDLLEDVLVKKMYPKKGVVGYDEQEPDYSAHQVIIDQVFDKQYYDVQGLYKNKRFTVESFVAHILGWKVYLKYMRAKSMLKKYIKRILYRKSKN